MKHYTTVQIPAREQKNQTHLTCDLCLGKSPEPCHWGRERGWSTDEDTVTISREVGNNSPDGGNKTTTSVDLCPTCFATRLIPWLVAQGAAIQIETFDW